ncbi:hypothetical protein CPB83DRAFT_842902 [Crepidotus variabilis]|uniref:Uncharacterized protein n=1 Tax=Crepidotus variabilis TaxID=179855 RepID=A0A9P6ERI1_9AGAR|nr:hypothetical protein CPB83DRAFT_842902 [Crepidotus variabilis]
MLTTRARPEQERSSRKLKSESRLYRFLTRSRSRSRSNNDDTLLMDKKQKEKQPKQTASLGRSTRPPINLNSPPGSKPRTRVQSRPLSSSTSATNTTITPAPTTPKAKRRLTTGAAAISQPSPPHASSSSRPPLSHSRSNSNSNSNSHSHSRPPTSDSTNSKRKRRFQDLFGGLSLGSLSRSRSRSRSRPPSPSPVRGSFDVHRHPLPNTPGSYTNHHDDGEELEEDVRDERRYPNQDEDDDERIAMDDKTPQPSRFLSASATTPHGSYSRRRHSHGRSPSPSPAPSPLPAVPLRGYLSLDHREHEGEDDLEDDDHVHGLKSRHQGIISRQVPDEEEEPELESTYDVDITPKMLRVTNPGTMYSVTTTTNSEAGDVERETSESVRGAMAQNPYRTSSTPSGGPPPYSYFSFDPNNSTGSSGPSTPPTHTQKLPSKLSESLMLTHEKRASDTSAIANVTVNRISGPFQYQYPQRRSTKDADLPPLPSPPLPLQSHSANGSQSSLHAPSPKLVGVPLKYTADQLLNANGLPIPTVGIGSSKTRSFGHVHAMKGSLDSSYRYRMNGKERMGVVDEGDDGQEVEVYGKESQLETPNSASGHSHHSSQSHSHSNHSNVGLGVNAKGKSRESTETHSLSHQRAQTLGLPSPRHSGTGRSSKHGSFDFERPLGYHDIQRSGSGENVMAKEKGRESDLGPGFAGVGTLQREISERRLKVKEEKEKRKEKEKGKERDHGVKGVHAHGNSQSTSHSHAHSTRTTPSEGHTHSQSQTQTHTNTPAHGKHSSMGKATGRRTAAHTSSAHGHGHTSSHGHNPVRASSKLAGGAGTGLGGLAGIGKPHHGLFSFEPPVRSTPTTTASVGTNGVSTGNGRSSGNALSTGSALSGAGDTTIRVGRVKSGGGVSGISGLSGGMSAVEWKTEKEYERVQKEKERQREKDRERRKGVKEGKAVPVPISSVGGPISISIPGALRGTASGASTPGGEGREGRPLTTSMSKANDYLSGILSGSWTAPSFLNRASKVFESKDKEKDRDKPLPSLLPVFSPPPKENVNIGHRSGTKGRSLDLGLGLAWASSKVPEEALLPRSTFMERAVSGERNRERSRDRERPRHGFEKGYGWSQGKKESVGSMDSGFGGRLTQLNGGDEHIEVDVETSKLGKQIAEVFRNALDDKGYKSFKSYVRQFDAHEIPFDGPTGIVAVVEHLLSSAPHLSDDGKKRLLDRFVKIILQQT